MESALNGVRCPCGSEGNRKIGRLWPALTRNLPPRARVERKSIKSAYSSRFPLAIRQLGLRAATFSRSCRDSCYGTSFDRRVRNLGITQARTPFRSPRANAIAERWVRSVRTECLDHVFIFSEWHLQKVLAEYVGYFNHWRSHRSIGQRAPCAPRTRASHRSDQAGKIIAIPVLGGLHHVYKQAA